MKETLGPEPDASAGYERRDFDLRAVIWLAAGVGLLCLIALAGLRLMLQVLSHQAARRDQAVSPLATETLPPEPRLQSTPVHDFEAFRHAQQERLNSSGWIDRQQGRAHIPIDLAMKILIERGEKAVTGGSPGTGAEPSSSAPVSAP